MMTPRGTASGDDPGADEPVVIKVRDNGPYKVTGPVVIVDADGNRFSRRGGPAGRAVPVRRVADEAVLRPVAPRGGLRRLRARRRRRRTFIVVVYRRIEQNSCRRPGRVGP